MRAGQRHPGRLIAASVFLLGLSTHAMAALTVKCPLNWDELPRLGGGDLDRVVHGVKVRDWKPEYLDEYLNKATECIRRSDNVDSIKQAQYPELRKQVEFARSKYFEDIQRAARVENQASAATKAKADAGLAGLKVDSDGVPTAIDLPTRRGGSTTSDCRDMKRPSVALTLDGHRQGAAFARLCAQVGRLDEATAAEVERVSRAAPALYQSVDAFVVQVEAAARAPFNESSTRELQKLAGAIATQQSAMHITDLDDSGRRYSRATAKVEEWSKQATAVACGRTYANSGMPAKWQRNLILLGPYEPTELTTLVCQAVGNGAQVRYLSGGLLSKEGFEVRSAGRTVQLFSELQSVAGGDPAIKIMVPAQAQVFGKKVDVNRVNLREIVAELAAAMANK